MDVFSFRRLRVYRLAMALVRYVYQATRMMPTDARAIVWQLLRASSSVALNIAEGCGEYSPKEKARFFRIARRSSWEAVAALDLLVAGVPRTGEAHAGGSGLCRSRGHADLAREEVRSGRFRKAADPEVHAPEVRGESNAWRPKSG